MEIKEIDIKGYECPICGTVYHNIEDAENCYNHYKFLEQFENAPPFYWYKIEYKYKWTDDFPDEKWHFIRKVELENKYCGNSSLNKKCNKTLALYPLDPKNSYQMGVPRPLSLENAKVTEWESLTEHFNKTGELPGPFNEELLNKLPFEIAQEYNECFFKKRHEIVSKYDNMTKEQLISLLISKEPIFTDFKEIDLLQCEGGFEEEDNAIKSFQTLSSF